MKRLLSRLIEAKGQKERSAKTISVVTPSYNQAEFLPACLKSVSVQTYKPFEHLVFDPGSTDSSREIAGRAVGVTLIAEPDEGQADAVGQGMATAQGDVIAWLNSDDEYADRGVFAAVLDRFNQDDQPDFVYGRGVYIDDKGKKVRDAYVNQNPETISSRLAHEVGLLQPAMFIRKTVIDRIGIPNLMLNFAMDYEFWIRASAAGMNFAFLDRVVAKARYYEDNKTLGKRGESYAEICKVAVEHYGFLDERWARRWAEFNVEGHDGILKHAENSPTHAESVDAETKRILAAFNWSHRARATIASGKIAPHAHTAAAMERYGIGLEQICKPVDSETPSGGGFLCYTVGDQRWGFKSGWANAQFADAKVKIEDLQESRRGDIAIIVGNGPSLNETDLTLLQGVDTFVSNYVYLNTELVERATHLAVVNNLVAEQGYAEFNMLRGIRKFFPYWLGHCIAPDDDTVLLKSVGYPEFSTDIDKNISWRHTVSFFHMQLVYALGYRRVALIGFDHSYAQDTSLQEGDVVDQTTDDENHFDPRYFRGKKWHAADPDNMEAMYTLAKAAYETDGRSIVNATVGGHLEIFDRVELAAFIGAAQPAV